jgi:hypothetical protein
MYRESVDQATRNDIAAAAAAHHELGRDYDDAVAEGLIDRIGTEIDKRVDARLGAGSRGPRPLTEASWSGRRPAMWTGVGIGAGVGAGIIGIVAVIANSGNNNDAVVVAVVAVWLILAVVGLGTVTVLARKYRSPGRG